jgi:histidinol phosphatase-like enzyme
MSQLYWFEKDKARRGCPCLFLDRDAVIVEEVDYLQRPEDVRALTR